MIVETIKIKEMGMFSELFLGISLIYLVIYGTFLSFDKKNKFPLLQNSMLSLGVLTLAMSCFLQINDNLIVLNYLSFNNNIANDYLSFASKIVIGIASLVCLLMIQQYVINQKINHFEYVLIILFAILGLFLLCSANDLITAYLAIELQSLAFYVLAAFKKNSTFSIEAGLKYFILGAFSSGLFLFGSSLVYGVTGSVNFEDFKDLFFWFFSGSSLMLQKLNNHDNLDVFFRQHFVDKTQNLDLLNNINQDEQLTRLKIINNKIANMSTYSFKMNEKDFETLYYQYLYFCNNDIEYKNDYREIIEKIYESLKFITDQKQFISFYNIDKKFLENSNDIFQYVKNFNLLYNLDSLREMKFVKNWSLVEIESQWDLDIKKLEKQYEELTKDMIGGQYNDLMVCIYLNHGGLENNTDFITGIKYIVHDIVFKDLLPVQGFINVETVYNSLHTNDIKDSNEMMTHYYAGHNLLKIFELIDKYNGRPGIDSKLEFFQRDDYQIKNYFYEPFDVSLLQFALVFIIVSLFFKLALAPFHLWSPDIYEGSPTSSTFFFAVVPKLGIFVLLLRICYFGFYGFLDNWRYSIVIIGMLSILIGSFVGLEQRKLKSLLAYSSISHMGYLLISFSTGTVEGIQMLFSYLIIYTCSGLCVWSIFVLTRLKNNYSKKQNKDLADLVLLSKSNKMLAIIFSIALLSIAGLPPMIGFIVKFGVFLVVIEASMYFVALFSILFSVISTFYYIRIIKILYFEKVLVGKLYYPIKTIKAVVVTLLFYFFIFLFVNPTLLYLFSYKISLLIY
uniref:NADH dehydrogenase subunit 2 n=1 Tax=Psammoneis japonica TaxID=517775 RepID=A0A2U9GJB7_9STRA|nr:NADH dehydrogenase subunit 2 [Psammoneis japonica]AWQ64271.1 NADH dehydrogenase subunit 2 [Psammoneis japonica]